MPQAALKCAPWNAKALKRSRGLWHSAVKLRAEQLGLWHSAVKFYHGVGILQFIGGWWLAFRGMFDRGMPQV
jgi:hypothetical protein